MYIMDNVGNIVMIEKSDFKEYNDDYLNYNIDGSVFDSLIRKKDFKELVKKEKQEKLKENYKKQLKRREIEKKEEEEELRKELEEIEKNKCYGFIDVRTLKGGKALKALNKKLNYRGLLGLASRKEFIEYMYINYKDSLRVIRNKEIRNYKTNTVKKINELNYINSLYYEITKTECDYMEFLINNDIKINLEA